MDAPSPKQQLGSSEGLAWVRSRIGEAPELSRYRLAREVCERLNWRDERGCLKEMACRKHLLHLERRGEIVLPPVRRLKPQRCRGCEPKLCAQAARCCEPWRALSLAAARFCLSLSQ